MTTTVERTTFLLRSRTYHDILRPDLSAFTTDDIAHSLSRIQRFCGHLQTDDWYSVAEHSVEVMKLVHPKLKLAALLHDAPEGLGLGDIIRPVKREIGGLYTDLEDLAASAIERRYDLYQGALEHPEIKMADNLVYARERVLLAPIPESFGAHPIDREAVDSFPVDPPPLACLNPDAAKRLFLVAWNAVAPAKHWVKRPDGRLY